MDLNSEKIKIESTTYEYIYAYNVFGGYAMKGALDKLTVKGFKSIRELNEFKLGDLNVIIGANGAGKDPLRN